MTTYPNDADGAVLAELAMHGVDMSQPLLIEFHVAVPDEASANKVLTAITEAGYNSQIVYDEGEPDYDPEIDDEEEFGPSWTVDANVRMIPEYNEIMRGKIKGSGAYISEDRQGGPPKLPSICS